LNQNLIEDNEKDDEHDERSTLRLSALEFMISLSEAGPNIVRKVLGWTDVIVRACLEGMGEFDEDVTEISGLEVWLREDVCNFLSFRCI
jgi:importin-5